MSASREPASSGAIRPRHVVKAAAVWVGEKLQDLGIALYRWGWS